MTTEFDMIVIGAGIAGASVAAHLAETHRVAILEMEDRPGFHTTGRSAAAYEPNYGPVPMLALTRASRRHFDQGGYLYPRDSLFVMPDGQEEKLAELMAVQVGMHEISVAEAKTKFPLLRDSYARRVILDPFTADIDVDLLHQNYLKLFRQRGASYSGARDYSLALADYNRSLELNPKGLDAYIGRAQVYDAMGERDKALKEFEAGIAIDEQYLLLFWERARMADRWGERQMAINDYIAVLKINGHWANARKHLERLGVYSPY